MLTASAWGQPSARYYRFLRKAERLYGSKRRLLVVGCADGKFVLPAARRGWEVIAVEIDERMVSGCSAAPEDGIDRRVPGLLSRLSTEGLAERVSVRVSDFMTEGGIGNCDALWTSGCLQYSRNSVYDISEITDRLRSFLHVEGVAYFEYMIPDEPKLVGRPNCPPVDWWSTVFPRRGWRIVGHTVAFDVPEGPHPYVPLPHRHSWGRLSAVRLRQYG